MISFTKIIRTQGNAHNGRMIGFKIPDALAVKLKICVFIYLRHRRAIRIPVPVNADPAHAAKNKIYVKQSGNSWSICIISIMLIMIFTRTTGYFRWISRRTTGNTVSYEFDQRKFRNFQCNDIMRNNLFNKYRTG